jgi:hypothetical protein
VASSRPAVDTPRHCHRIEHVEPLCRFVARAEASQGHDDPDGGVGLQDLQWRRRYGAGTTATAAPDPVQQIAFRFYDQLFRLAIDYERDRTQGLTDSDIVGAISAMCGPIITPTGTSTRAVAPQTDEESGPGAGSSSTGYSHDGEPPTIDCEAGIDSAPAVVR